MTRQDLENRTIAFTANWKGKGINFDGAYGNQCMDLAEQFNRDVVGAPRIGGNAIDAPHLASKDHYDWIPNTPTNFPLKGDLVVWNYTPFGHIAVAEVGNPVTFDSLDQNFPMQGYTDKNGNFIGTGVAHIERHHYAHVIGFLRPKTQEAPAPAVIQPAPISIPAEVPHVDPTVAPEEAPRPLDITVTPVPENPPQTPAPVEPPSSLPSLHSATVYTLLSGLISLCGIASASLTDPNVKEMIAWSPWSSVEISAAIAVIVGVLTTISKTIPNWR
jgi:hypothetical protein